MPHYLVSSGTVHSRFHIIVYNKLKYLTLALIFAVV